MWRPLKVEKATGMVNDALSLWTCNDKIRVLHALISPGFILQRSSFPLSALRGSSTSSEESSGHYDLLIGRDGRG